MTRAPVLRIPPAARARLEELARRGHPLEACGLLLGRAAAGAACAEVVEVAALANLARARARYELDPAEQLACELRARAAGLEVLGVWHTHPDHPARPSERDLRGAWEGWSYVIVSVGPEGVRELRSWRLRDGAFHEEPCAP